MSYYSEYVCVEDFILNDVVYCNDENIQCGELIVSCGNFCDVTRMDFSVYTMSGTPTYFADCEHDGYEELFYSIYNEQRGLIGFAVSEKIFKRYFMTLKQLRLNKIKKLLK